VEVGESVQRDNLLPLRFSRTVASTITEQHSTNSYSIVDISSTPSLSNNRLYVMYMLQLISKSAATGRREILTEINQVINRVTGRSRKVFDDNDS